MNNDEYLRIFKKAKNFASRYGLGDESEDFAQEYAIKCFETGYHQKLEWALSDYSSKLRADKRVLSSPSGYQSKGLTVSLDQPLGTSDDDGPTVLDTIGVSGSDMEHRSELSELHQYIELLLGNIRDQKSRDEIRGIYMNWLEEQL